MAAYPYVLVLTGADAKDSIAELVSELALMRLQAAPQRELGENAYEILISSIDSRLHQRLHALAKGRSLDINCLPTEKRRKKILVADMDSTIINIECIDELATYASCRDEVASITESAMRGDIDFAKSLRARVSLLKGVPESALEEILLEKVRLNPGAEQLVRTMHKFGAQTALVSGGFTYFASDIARRAGFDRFYANRLQIFGRVVTGKTEGPVVDGEGKRQFLSNMAMELNYPLSATMAVGDGANDKLMVNDAGLGVAYRGKESLKQVADAVLDHSHLEAALYLQGYRQEEFALR